MTLLPALLSSLYVPLSLENTVQCLIGFIDLTLDDLCANQRRKACRPVRILAIVESQQVCPNSSGEKNENANSRSKR